MVWQVLAWAVVAIVVGVAGLVMYWVYDDVQAERRKQGKPPSFMVALGVIAGNVLAWAAMLGIIYIVLRVKPGAIAALLNGTGRYGD